MNPLLRRRLPIISTLAVVLVGLLLIALGHWRRGAFVIGLAALLATALRVAIPEKDVGVLAVRSKLFDLVFLLLAAAVFLGLSLLSD